MSQNIVYDRAYRIAHQEEIKNKNKSWRLAHKKEINAYARIYHVTHREQKLAQMKIYRTKHAGETRLNRLKKTYGLSESEFNKLLDKQGGVCAICGRSNYGGRKPAIDHDHITKKVRGLLCTQCNSALGMIANDPKIAQAMIDYLKRHESKII